MACQCATHFAFLQVSKHMLIHLPNAAVLLALRAWNAVRHAQHLVLDNWPYTRANADIGFGGYRELNLYKPPFSLAASAVQCADIDHSMCEQVPSYRTGRPRRWNVTALGHFCRPRIEMYDLPLVIAADQPLLAAHNGTGRYPEEPAPSYLQPTRRCIDTTLYGS